MNLVEYPYEVDGVSLTGFLADGSDRSAVPGVLVAHEAPGVTKHVKQRVELLANRGFVAFALDMYGEADLPLDAARKHSRRLMADATLMRRRARAALAMVPGVAKFFPAKL